jgi:hypothetical protein
VTHAPTCADRTHRTDGCFDAEGLYIDQTPRAPAPPPATPEQLAQAAKLRGEGRKGRQDAHDSFERCDTDGFLSQWASGINAQLDDAKARILEAGGTAEFPGLFFKASGLRAKAKKIAGKFGPCWAFVDEAGNFTGEFLGDARGPRSKLTKAGFEVRYERAPAWAKISAPAGARGLGGAASCYVEVYRKDAGYPSDPASTVVARGLAA